ncbi:MAG: dienelactone hydrolase family protein [Cyanobium sp.]
MCSLSLSIPAGAAPLAARLQLPTPCRGLVVFVHGSGSDHRSPRNRAVAARLEQASLATLLFDWLTADEQRHGVTCSSEIALASDRLLACLAWLDSRIELQPLLPLGLFGASTGAAAALHVAAARPERIAALVCRGGRLDLAADALPRVSAPTLLVVGSRDPAVLALNRQAAEQLHCRHRLAVVPGAGHLFAEPGCLEALGVLARDWFLHHLPATASPGEDQAGRGEDAGDSGERSRRTDQRPAPSPLPGRGS